jgi:hypothetical protein
MRAGSQGSSLASAFAAVTTHTHHHTTHQDGQHLWRRIDEVHLAQIAWGLREHEERANHGAPAATSRTTHGQEDFILFSFLLLPEGRVLNKQLASGRVRESESERNGIMELADTVQRERERERGTEAHRHPAVEGDRRDAWGSMHAMFRTCANACRGIEDSSLSLSLCLSVWRWGPPARDGGV